MIIPCGNCSANVDGTLVGQIKFNARESDYPHIISLLECPACGDALVGCTDYSEIDGDYEWGMTSRVWPDPLEGMSNSIPPAVRKPLIAAGQCFENMVFSASAAMSRQAVDALCREKTGSTDTQQGIHQMNANGVINNRFLEWGNALLVANNLGGQGATLDVNRQDASDVLEFARALCDQVYVLGPKVDDYFGRQRKR